jgi:hypothetical protein
MTAWVSDYSRKQFNTLITCSALRKGPQVEGKIMDPPMFHFGRSGKIDRLTILHPHGKCPYANPTCVKVTAGK